MQIYRLNFTRDLDCLMIQSSIVEKTTYYMYLLKRVQQSACFLKNNNNLAYLLKRYSLLLIWCEVYGNISNTEKIIICIFMTKRYLALIAINYFLGKCPFI